MARRSKASATSIAGGLEPLLSEAPELKSEYLRRSKSYEVKSVHISEVAEWQEKGWELQRPGKRKASMKRPKAHNVLLEDRVWCLLYRMRYPMLNGSRFIVSFGRNDGSNGRKQIDVFGCDDETAFVIECKSKRERGRRSLQKDILETEALQGYLTKSIHQLYGDKAKPRIIWAYVTQNIIWTEPDVERASAANIHILTENETQYLETYLKHLGPAGKYQVLGTFLRGKKVPGLGRIEIPATKGTIGGETFYSFVISPDRLLKIAFVNHHALNNPEGRPAYQRMISAKRIKKIEEFIVSGGIFPTNLIVNFMEKVGFDPITHRKDTDTGIQFGWLTLPNKYCSAWVIDGQHRLYGYSHLEGEERFQNLLVLAFENMNTAKEADLFITINHEQKSVPKNLLISLLADIRLDSPDPKIALQALASSIFRDVNNDKTSPLFRRFSMPGLPPEPSQNLTIPEAVKGLSRSELLGKASGKMIVPGPFSGPTDDATRNRSVKILNRYFHLIRDASPQRWDSGREAYVSINPGIRAYLQLLGEAVDYIKLKSGLDFHALSEEAFVLRVAELIEPVSQFIRTASDEEMKRRFSRKFGEGGVKEYYYFLCRLIHERRSDFGSEEFRRHVEQSESAMVAEANEAIIRLNKKIMDVVIATLKSVHGTKPTESGDPAYFEIGIQKDTIKRKAYERQLEDKGKKQRKEAYLDILDLKGIIEQPNNWQHFESTFSIPMRDEKKGKKYYTAWLTVFNELRRIPAHTSSLKTYSDEDFEVLEWLRSEVEPRLNLAETYLGIRP